MFSFVMRVIPALLRMAFPVVVRLVILVFIFHACKFLIRQWKGLGKR